jgi:hypothetical protein
LEDRRSELLETQYFHVVFTVPDKIAAIAYQNKQEVYNILFRAVRETLQTIAADPKHGLSYGLIGRNLGLSKNTVMEIVRREATRQPMPAIPRGSAEISDVVAYILSLRRRNRRKAAC